MTNTTMDNEKLRSWIGRSRTETDILHPKPCQLMAATLGWDTPPFQEGDPLPPAWHWLYFLDARPPAELGRDGHAALGAFLPPVTLPRRMWAGGRFRFSAPLILGEAVRKKSTIQDVNLKSGRSGDLCFVTVRHDLYRGDELCLSEDHDIVYRNDPSPGTEAPLPPLPEAEAEHTETVTPNPVLLFRYSALTFNGHRIHYDVDYCRDVEGYPGLVFHGPLTATLLLDLARRHGDSRTLKDFSYRAISPLFDTAPFTLALRRIQGGFSLWAINAEGRLAMTAKVEFTE